MTSPDIPSFRDLMSPTLVTIDLGGSAWVDEISDGVVDSPLA